MGKISNTLMAVRVLGFRHACSYLLKERILACMAKLLPNRFKDKSYNLHSPVCSTSLLCRLGSSDRSVFRQIFVIQEYAPISNLNSPKLIVDCGANVGYSSVYFLSTFPNAHVIAIEPDHDNFTILKQNLRAYGNRVTTLNTGVWSACTGLSIKKGQYRDGLDWSTQVCECTKDQEPDIIAVDIPSVLADSGMDRIDILKIDIERAEVELFSKNYENWIKQVRTIVIELHDDECRSVFFQALSNDDWKTSTSHELTIAERQGS